MSFLLFGYGRTVSLGGTKCSLCNKNLGREKARRDPPTNITGNKLVIGRSNSNISKSNNYNNNEKYDIIVTSSETVMLVNS